MHPTVAPERFGLVDRKLENPAWSFEGMMPLRSILQTDQAGAIVHAQPEC